MTIAIAAAYALAAVLQCAAAAHVLRQRGLPLRGMTARIVYGIGAAALLAVNGADGMRAALLLAAAATAAATDLSCGLVLDVTSYGALAALIALGAGDQHLAASLVGAAACGGVLALLHAVTRGRGLGLGDVKLAAAIGAGIGGAASLVAIGAAFVIGAAVGLASMAAGRARAGDRVAFAPFLGLGAVGTLLWSAHHG